jgi:hypothetical protein
MRHPFFRPLWVRIAIVAVCFAWATLELSRDEGTWAVIFGAIGGYAAYNLLFAWVSPEDDEDNDNA